MDGYRGGPGRVHRGSRKGAGSEGYRKGLTGDINIKITYEGRRKMTTRRKKNCGGGGKQNFRGGNRSLDEKTRFYLSQISPRN